MKKEFKKKEFYIIVNIVVFFMLIYDAYYIYSYINSNTIKDTPIEKNLHLFNTAVFGLGKNVSDRRLTVVPPMKNQIKSKTFESSHEEDLIDLPSQEENSISNKNINSPTQNPTQNQIPKISVGQACDLIESKLAQLGQSQNCKYALSELINTKISVNINNLGKVTEIKVKNDIHPANKKCITDNLNKLQPIDSSVDTVCNIGIAESR